MFSEWYYNVIHRYFLVPWRLDVWSLWYNMIKMPLHFDFAKSYKIGTKYENLQEQSLRWVNTFNSGHSYVRNDRSTFFYATRNRCREKVPHVWLGNSWNNGQFRDVYLNFSVGFAPILLISPEINFKSCWLTCWIFSREVISQNLVAPSSTFRFNRGNLSNS